MTQTVPNWTAIILGGGLLGAVTSAATLVTKGLVDQKEERIKHLIRNNEALKEQVSGERQKVKEVLDLFREQLHNIDTGNLNAADLLHLQEVFGLIEDFGELVEGFEDCKRAADWLESRKDVWVTASSKQAVSKYKRLLPRSRLKGFKDDLGNYLNWVHACLYIYGGRTANIPISDNVKMPVLTSAHPYIAAINFLIDLEDWGELSPKPRAYLREVLVRLTEQLSNEFT
ncbi:MAG: hypothetical protein AAFY17_07025 [Cyanobacteria bacterium J06642_11]